MRKKYLFDIDGTICITEHKYKDMQKNYKEAIPKKDVIKKINKLYEKGNLIFFYSSRHWIDFELTTKQLKKWNVNYHNLILGKPVAHYYVDECKKLIAVEDLE